ncbi:hypothetical protein NDN08_008171 [Rhodosorus marinus]|uniref:Uncharacterized protein n=1 Tax=Rhodosorus marinus TaxID=101924 RepID=A0AAV8UZT5_9RHOD|nr:hypothetical protein NDN08_008171 [Rhodosorus marinus]
MPKTAKKNQGFNRSYEYVALEAVPFAISAECRLLLKRAPDESFGFATRGSVSSYEGVLLQRNLVAQHMVCSLQIVFTRLDKSACWSLSAEQLLARNPTTVKDTSRLGSDRLGPASIDHSYPVSIRRKGRNLESTSSLIQDYIRSPSRSLAGCLGKLEPKEPMSSVA